MIHQLKVASICITEKKDGFWLYDNLVGMNIAMREATEKDAILKALSYYQERLQNVEKSYFGLKGRVEAFMEGEGWKEVDQSEEDFLSSYR